MTQQVFTHAGARGLDQAAVAAARAQTELVQLEVERQRGVNAAELRTLEAEARKAELAAAAREASLKEAERARADAVRAQKRAARRVWFAERRALFLTLVVIASSMGIAWPAQATYFVGAGMGLLGLAVPVVVEGPQWLSAVLTARAVKTQAPTWPFQLSTWLFAAVAASINYSHGALHSRLLGVIYALASLTGMIAWELYVLSARAHVSGRTVADRRRDFGRRISFRKEFKAAVRLRRAMPNLNSEQAWEMAWRLMHAAPPGLTAGMLQAQNAAIQIVTEASGAAAAEPVGQDPIERSAAAAMGVRERVMALGLVLPPSVFDDGFTAHPVPVPGRSRTGSATAETGAGAAADSQVAPRNPPSPKSPRKRKAAPQSAGARRAAAHTAAAAQADPQAARQLQVRAAQRYAELKASGEWRSYIALGEEFGKSEAWARAAVQAHGGLHLANAA